MHQLRDILSPACYTELYSSHPQVLYQSYVLVFCRPNLWLSVLSFLWLSIGHIFKFSNDLFSLRLRPQINHQFSL